MQIQELFSLIKTRQFETAIAEIQKFLVQSPNHKDGLNLLGVAYNQLGEFSQAKATFSIAVQNYPSHFQSRLNLALCQVQLNEMLDAKDSLIACDQIQPNHPDVLNALGNIHRLEGNLNEAELMLKKAFTIAPNNPAIFENLAWLALKSGNVNKAEQQFAKLHNAFPNNTSVTLGLAECRFKQEKLSAAQEILSSVLHQQSSNADAHLLLSLVLNKHQKYEQRLHHLELAIKHNPRLVAAHFQLGLAQQELGNESQSAKHFETVVKLKPTYFEAYFHLAYKRGYDFSGLAQIEQLNQLCHQYQNSPELYWLYFALGKVEENNQHYQQAFNHFNAARKHFARFSKPTKETTRPFESLKQASPYLASQSSIAPQFIFVTGMPRSGTTLTDQILDCHSTVHSIGESGIVAQLAALVENKTKLPYYVGVNKLTHDEKSQLVTQVLTERKLTHHPIILDTTPNNVFYVSFILSLIANSKVIFCKRSPLDTCLSIYQYPLAQQDYANKLKTLGKYYLNCDSLINHWQSIYADHTTTLLYEQLINSPQQSISQLLSWLNLGFEQSCLTPEANKRHVLTPSSEQVRKPMNNKSIGKWKKFSPYIEELMVILNNSEDIYQQKLIT